MASQESDRNERPLDPRTEDAPLPRYYLIQTEIRKKIESGTWLPGEMIPPERKIAGECHVSVGTVRRAIQDLVAEGFVYRVQGKGTLVAGTNLKREILRYYRFREDFTAKEASHRITLLSLEKIPGQAHINRLLRVSGETELYLLKRVFTYMGKPIVYSISCLPTIMVPGLEEFSRHRLERVPLYLSLEEKYGIPTKQNEELIDVAFADAEVAEVLHLEKGSPLIRIEMLCFTYRRRPYEYRTSWCSTESHKLVRVY